MVVFLLNFIQNNVEFFPECTINYVKKDSGSIYLEIYFSNFATRKLSRHFGFPTCRLFVKI